MKARLLIPLFLLLTVSAQSQTFDEWFRQKRTQEKYLVQQIAALQAYSGTLRQGYELARDGIHTVRHIKNGDLGLHQVFFRSLEQVNPVIRDAPQVRDILACQAAIPQVLAAQRKFIRHPLFTADELAYLQQVQARVWDACADDLETLCLLLTADVLKMPDDSRLRHLEVLHTRTYDTYRFTRSFLAEAELLALQRAQENRHLERIRALYANP